MICWCFDNFKIWIVVGVDKFACVYKL